MLGATVGHFLHSYSYYLDQIVKSITKNERYGYEHLKRTMQSDKTFDLKA